MPGVLATGCHERRRFVLNFLTFVTSCVPYNFVFVLCALAPCPAAVYTLYTPCVPRLFIRRFQEGLAFLAANKLKEGVVETASGLQYKVLKSGPDGGKTPLKTTKCLCHYKGECCGVCLLQHGL